MECSHCGHVEDKEFGNFFILDLGDDSMWRWSVTMDYSDVAKIIGCPKCRKTFIDFKLFNFEKW